MENMRNYRDIKLVNDQAYSNTLMYEFGYDYIKPKYRD